MDSILELLRKIARLAADPAAPPGERDAAAAKLRQLMARHGITEAALHVTQRTRRTLLPRPQNPGETMLACHIVALIQNVRICNYYQGPTLFQYDATPAEHCDITDCWQHYLRIYQKEVKNLGPKKATIAARIKALRKEIALQQAALKELPKQLVVALAYRFNLFAPDDDDEARQPPTPEQLAAAQAALNMSRHIHGARWQPKAGHLQQRPLELS